jgi:hypothetical protein
MAAVGMDDIIQRFHPTYQTAIDTRLRHIDSQPLQLPIPIPMRLLSLETSLAWTKVAEAHVEKAVISLSSR